MSASWGRDVWRAERVPDTQAPIKPSRTHLQALLRQGEADIPEENTDLETKGVRDMHRSLDPEIKTSYQIGLRIGRLLEGE